MIELMEPPKAAVRALKPGNTLPREARVNAFCDGKVGVWKLVVSLSKGKIVSDEFLESARPMILIEEFMAMEDVVRSDARFIAACEKRGVTDMSLVCIDPWSAGNFGIAEEEGRHICHTFAWLRTREHDNLYAHPIEGVCAIVDIKTQEVLRVDDHGVVPVPMTEYNFDQKFRTDFRDDLKPLDVVQPEGVSFTVDDQRITWHDWSILAGFNAREGLTLHDISFAGRDLLYRASLAEMVVPYGSPLGGHPRKSVFDIGEYGIGKLANSLKLGCDCLGAIAYLDAWLNDWNGDPYCIENAICIHEEDYGILWKHLDLRTDRVDVRRARRLVVSSISTVGNYEYGSYWYFYLDGTIEYEIKATGILNTAACEPGNAGKYATEVAPGVVGQIHQHVFCARLDMAVDGDRNSVIECNTRAEPYDDRNPYGNAFYVEQTPLNTELAACRRADPTSQRFWTFVNSNKHNQVGGAVGYKLEPQHTLTPFIHPNSPSGKRSGFIQNHLWVTAYDPEERYPAGDFMNHSDGKRRAAGICRQGPSDRQQRYRCLACIRSASPAAAGGFSGSALRYRRLQADADRFL